MKKIEKAERTLIEMLMGIFAYAVAAQIICIIIGYDLAKVSAGLWLGVILAAVMAVHMKRSLEDALDLGESGALKHIRKTYLLRITAVLFVLGAALYFRIGNVFSAFAGLMSLKIAAYLQPVMHKILTKTKKSK